MDTEQVWTVLAGQASVLIGGETVLVTPGDTLVIPADVPRRVTGRRRAASPPVTAAPTGGFAAIVVAPAGTRAYPLDGTKVAAACAQPAGEKLIPAWAV
jgi:uncharacterized protein YjlB